MQPATIKLFLVSGSPTGLRTAEISNWTGKAIAGPRSDLDDLLARKELSSPGVYLLSGTDAETGEPVVYIGEAENVSKRLKQHAKNEDKDYWVHTSAFVSKDENLTKAHIRYIEGKLIEKAFESRKVVVMNSASSGSSLPEADRAEMDVYIERMLQLLPVLGVHQFSTPLLAESPIPGQTPSLATGNTTPEVHCSVKGLTAKGKRSEDGFMVFKGSQAVKAAVNSCSKNILNIRNLLLSKGILQEEGESLVFTDNYEFSSPSAAGAVIKGRNTNGLTSWRNDSNQTLRDLES